MDLTKKKVTEVAWTRWLKYIFSEEDVELVVLNVLEELDLKQKTET